MLTITELKDYVKNDDWTDAFKQAVERLNAQGGGTIYVPAGSYHTRSIQLKSNMVLHLEAGALLDFTDDIENYEVISMEFEGIAGSMYKPLIFASGEENVSVTGQGKMNGNGQRWWKESKGLPHRRPYFVCFDHCKHVRLEGITLENSPVWTVHPIYSEDVVIHGVKIKNPADSPNTDGIDPDSSRNVRISDCIIDVGDDCIAIKSGTEDTPDKQPCENITITNCNMLHGHGGVVIGSEMSGCVRNVTISNCVFQETDRGIRLKTRRQRGGAMENMVFDNIVMDKVMCPFVFNMYYYCGARGKEKHVWDKAPYPLDETTPAMKNVIISNIMVTEATAAAGFMYGLAEQPVENIMMSNCSIRMAAEGEAHKPAMMDGIEPMQGHGFFLRNAKGISFSNVRIMGAKGEAIDKDDTVDIVIL
ncbi:MAG: glycoside hydrolase family 28 protein [Lachnospiraceae bacterium]|nr:glycoside hydrolase family 28 protein [Lachnospiraceae bacterium]